MPEETAAESRARNCPGAWTHPEAVLRIEGKWISTGLTLVPGNWREATGIECEYDHDYFSVRWAAHPPGLDREAGFREMEEALRRRAVAHAFELNGFLDITVGERNDTRSY